MTLEKERAQWEEQAASQPIPSRIVTENETISGVSCLWLHPQENSKDKGIILYCHGGGLISGSILTHRNFSANIVEATGHSVLLVDYRLLPENRFPAPLDDIVTVYKSLASREGICPEGITFGGDSSGGGLALSALIQLRDEGIDLPSKVFTLSGVFDMTMSGDSMKADPLKEPFLRLEELKKWQSTYFENMDSPLLSPLFSDLSRLPPSLILVGSDELWLSDSIRIHEKLQREGNESKIRIWKSMTHVWAMDPNLNESGEALNEIRAFIKKGAKKSSLTTPGATAPSA